PLIQTFPKKANFSRRWFDEVQQHPNGRGFARAIRTKKAKNLAPFDLQIHSIHGGAFAIHLGQPNRVQNRFLGGEGKARKRDGFYPAQIVNHACALPAFGRFTTATRPPSTARAKKARACLRWT